MGRSWGKAARETGVDVWTRSDNSWEGLDPPEDRALPPDLEWTRQAHEQAVRDYDAKFGRFRAPGQRYDMSWPPEGWLCADGAWIWVDAEQCSEHGDEHDQQCEECADLELDHEEILEPARWEWYVTVTTLVDELGPDGQFTVDGVDDVRHLLKITEMDPRDVEYGPYRDSPDRVLLEMSYQTQLRQPEAPPVNSVSISSPSIVVGPVAVAVRLRRAWLGEIGDWLQATDNDLGDCRRETVLLRVGSRLDLCTPYNFGEGDPLAGQIGAQLRSHVQNLTAGAVTEVAWRFAGTDAKPIRRNKSSDIDIYHPSDPDLGDYAAAVEALRRRIPEHLTREAHEVLAQLTVSGISHHRLWLATPSEDARLAIGSTPGAAFAVHECVRKVQQKDPLYRVYVDPSVEGPRLTSP